MVDRGKRESYKVSLLSLINSTSSFTTMSLQAAADARKEKLAALKKRKTLHDSGDSAPTQASADKSVHTPSFH